MSKKLVTVNTNPTYTEYKNDCRQMLADAIITGGLKAMGDKFEFTCLNWYHNIMQTGGFKPS